MELLRNKYSLLVLLLFVGGLFAWMRLDEELLPGTCSNSYECVNIKLEEFAYEECDGKTCGFELSRAIGEFEIIGAVGPIYEPGATSTIREAANASLESVTFNFCRYLFLEQNGKARYLLGICDRLENQQLASSRISAVREVYWESDSDFTSELTIVANFVDGNLSSFDLKN